MGFSPRRPVRTNSHFLNVLRTLWWSYNGLDASESPLGNTGKKDQPPRLQKAILLHLCSLCAHIFRPPRAKQYKRDQLLSLHTSRLFERLNDPLQLDWNTVMFCADLAAFPSCITAVHLFHKASTARKLRRFVPQLQHLQVLLETNKPICHLRGNREYFCHSEHPVFSCRTLITGMVSGSIVAFNIDFNRWHYEHQSRYWEPTGCRQQEGGGGTSPASSGRASSTKHPQPESESGGPD